MSRHLAESLRPIDQLGLTVAAILSLGALAAFVGALGIVTSVLVFKTNVLSLDTAAVGAGIAVSALLLVAVALHRTLWAAPARA